VRCKNQRRLATARARLRARLLFKDAVASKARDVNLRDSDQCKELEEQPPPHTPERCGRAPSKGARKGSAATGAAEPAGTHKPAQVIGPTAGSVRKRSGGGLDQNLEHTMNYDNKLFYICQVVLYMSSVIILHYSS